MQISKAFNSKSKLLFWTNIVKTCRKCKYWQKWIQLFCLFLKWIRANIFSKMDFQDFFNSAHFFIFQCSPTLFSIRLLYRPISHGYRQICPQISGYLAHRLRDIGLQKVMDVTVRVSHSTFLHKMLLFLKKFLYLEPNFILFFFEFRSS
jgi:hypothetical protein